MDIDTGDHPPICQKPYTLVLKHYEWVQKEVEQLEQTGIITRSVSPWTSPIVIVLKKSAPDEPPRRSMCIDFCRLNVLQLVVVKVDSKAKGNLTLHPLPKIDELYMKLNGVKKFSALDLTNGYYHIELGEASQAETAFVTPFGKWEFNMVPFSLTQALAYFQALISKDLKGLSHFVIAPRSPREIKQILGLVGYYRKFIPRFSDIVKPLMRLTRHDTLFQWSKMCEFAFQSLKNALCTKLILKFPDPQKLYVLFTDASKYAWAGVLTQPYTEEIKGKVVTTHYPVTYVSRLFRGSQLNWVALTKEVYAIYMSIKKLSFYLTDAEITLRSDHLPFKTFLLKNTLNSKVNNWAVELETFNIKFEHILGIKNTLADTLSRIIKVDPEAQPACEKEGYEFGYSCFEELLPAEVFKVEEKIVKDVKLQPNIDIGIPEMECTLPLPKVKLCELQFKDELCQNNARQVNTNTIHPGHIILIGMGF